MSNITQRFILTGPLAGKTITLGALPYRFVDGVFTLSGPAEDVALHGRFMEINWQAYPEGHEKLKEVQDGQRDVQTTAQQDPQPAVSGDVPPQGEGSGAGDATDDGTGTTEAATGEAGSVAGGDGQSPELNQKLQRAVFALDPENDAHWTADGQPAMSAVEKLYGSSDVTRAQVKAVAPKYTREAARKPAAGE